MYKRIIYFSLILLSIVGCKKDPGNVLPVDRLDDQNYPKTIADLQTILVPGYSNLRCFALYGRQYLPIVLSTDHTFCSTKNGNYFRDIGGEFLINSVDPANNPNAQLYSFLYQGVASMNICIEKCDYYINAFGDTAHVKPIRGQAYFLRGYYLYLLECFYGEKYIDMTQAEDPNVLGIPLPITYAQTFTEANLPRSSAFQVWSQIIADFTQSTSDLQNVDFGADRGRVTQWAAKGMLGKAYVFTNQMDKAKPVLLDVINNSGKQLMSFSQYKDAFNGNPLNEFNQESLFELNVDRQPSNPNATFVTPLASLTTDQGVTFAPTIIGAGGQDGNGPGSPNMGAGYCQYFIHDKSLNRFGFNIPVYTLVANPNHPQGAPSTASNPSAIMDPVSWQYSLDARTNKTVDPRLFICGLEPWVDSCEQPSLANKPGANPTNVPDTIPVGKAFIISGDRDSYWGWSFKKYATTDDVLASGGAYGQNDAANIYLLRLADVYLLYAEANATSDPVTALEYVNKVHRRAYDGSTTYDYTSLSSPTLAKGANDELANDPLKYERYVELFGEGGWFFDVCRWGIGASEANYYVYGTAAPDNISGPGTIPSNAWSGSGANIEGAHFPFPIQEIQSNSSIQRNNFPY